jgi:hypothetical protein
VLSVATAAEVMNVIAAAKLVADMLNYHHDYSSVVLLESATVIWTLNVVLFSLSYWQVDRGGPEGRALGAPIEPDFDFAGVSQQAGAQLGFVDYLYLAFAVATAFVLPDYMRPVSARAKLISMAQASVSLTTLFIIAARAITALS